MVLALVLAWKILSIIIHRYFAVHDDILPKEPAQLIGSCLEAVNYGQQGTYVLLKHWY
jgi:hypothetical protein